jgi:GT2 family glycosyltransferase
MSIIFSVVVPTRNRSRALHACLDALARQRFSSDAFEVIVVNDGGSEPLAHLEAAFRNRLQCTFLHQPHLGPAAARNRAALQARGEFLAFTDDDCRPAPDWLTRYEQVLRNNSGCLAGGHVVNAAGDRGSEASQHLVDFLYQTYRDNGVPRFFTSNNLAISRGNFQSLGGFDESFSMAAAEDRDFCRRWARAGRPMVYLPEAVVHHFHALDTPRFLGQHFRYGRGARLFHIRCAAAGRDAVRIEPPRFYLSLFLYPLRLKNYSSIARLQIWLLFMLSQVANTAGYFYEVWRAGAV